MQEAFAALERAGYHVGSAYTAVKNPAKTHVRLSRSAVGGRGPASASASRRSATSTACTCRTSTRGETYQAAIERGEIPLGRAYRPTDEERLIREFVLQLKRGSIGRRTSRRNTASTCSSASRGALARSQTTATSRRPSADRIALTREALLRVDVLLPRFFLPEHTGIRYT